MIKIVPPMTLEYKTPIGPKNTQKSKAAAMLFGGKLFLLSSSVIFQGIHLYHKAIIYKVYLEYYTVKSDSFIIFFMTLTLDENKANYQIRGFKPGFIQVNDQTLTQSIIISSEKLIENWKPQHFSELTSDHLTIIITLHPTILLIGTGTKIHFPPIEMYGNLINQGIGVEIMDTSAACRTYNALTAEGRKVVAALIIN